MGINKGLFCGYTCISTTNIDRGSLRWSIVCENNIALLFSPSKCNGL